MGDFITVQGQSSYMPTPDSFNYCPTSRTFTAATVNNVTVSPKFAVSWDDTWNLTKLTATGASPSITITSVADSALAQAIVSGSIWVSADATHPPDTSSSSAITMTMTDGASGQSISQTISPGVTPDRFALSQYFTNASTNIKLKLSWTSPTGVIYIDSAQIEPSPYATEYIDNITAFALERTVFADPSRMIYISQYYPGTVPTYNNLLFYNADLYPHERAVNPDALAYRYVSNQGGQFNMRNVPTGTHIMYRAKAVPFKLTGNSGEAVPAIPDPWIWVVVQGAKAFIMNSMYDVGVNQDSVTAVKAFDELIDEMIMMSDPSPNYTWVHNPYPRMRTY